MRKLIITGLSIVSFSLFILFACGDPAGVTIPITVTSPTSSIIWEHYQADVTIGWSGGTTNNVSIKLVKAGEIVVTLATAAPNSGTFTLSERVSTSWSTGTDYIIRIEDGLGEIGNSAEFEIAASSGEDIIQVTNPSGSTEWCYYQENLTIAWSYPSTRSGSNASVPVNEARSTGCFSGDSVDIELYQGESLVATLGSGVSSTAGSYTYAGPVPTTWSTGSDYKVRVIDDLGNYGFSGTFSISESSGEDIITVIDPNLSTEWEYLQDSVLIVWNYDWNAKLSNSRNEYQPCTYDSVSIFLYRNSSEIDFLSGWIPNTGSYVYNGPVKEEWGFGTSYQIYIEDSNLNYGFSDEFSIGYPSNDSIIIVSDPNYNTSWQHGNQDLSIHWHYDSLSYGIDRTLEHKGKPSNVHIELWQGNQWVADLCDWVSNINYYSYQGPVPETWNEASDYRVLITDTYGNSGSSEQFEISQYYPDSIIYTLDVSVNPHDICIIPSGEEIYITHLDTGYETDQVSIYNTSNYELVLELFNQSHRPITEHPSLPYVYSAYADYIYVINTETHNYTTHEIGISSKQALLVSEEGNYLYQIGHAASSWLQRVSIPAYEFAGYTMIPSDENDMALVVNTSYLCVSHGNGVNVVDENSFNTYVQIVLGTVCEGICCLNDGSKLYTSLYNSNQVAVIDASTFEVSNTINVGRNPIGIEAHPHSHYVYVANSGSNTVSIINSLNDEIVKTIDVGQSPRNLCISYDGEYVYVVNNTSNSISIIH